MPLATHLGPWNIGTVKNTVGVTVGNIANMGTANVAQTALVSTANLGTGLNPLYGPTGIWVPPRSKFTYLVFDFIGGAWSYTSDGTAPNLYMLTSDYDNYTGSVDPALVNFNMICNNGWNVPIPQYTHAFGPNNGSSIGFAQNYASGPTASNTGLKDKQLYLSCSTDDTVPTYIRVTAVYTVNT